MNRRSRLILFAMLPLDDRAFERWWARTFSRRSGGCLMWSSFACRSKMMRQRRHSKSTERLPSTPRAIR
jgi:hypothetical protein